MHRTQESTPATGPAGTAVSPPPLLAAGPGEPLTTPWFLRSRQIAAAVRLGELAEAVQIAEELHQDVAAERGTEHPEALAVQEIRAYLAHLGGDHLLAARLYRETAAAAGRAGAPAYWTATINAQASEALANGPARPGALALAALRAVSATGRAAAAPAGRRTVVVALVAAAVLAVAAVPPTDRSDVRPQAGAPLELATAPVLLALEQTPAVPAVPPLPAPAPGPTAGPAPVVEETEPEHEDDQAQDADQAVRPAAPRKPTPKPSRGTGPGGQVPRPQPQASAQQPADPAPGGQGDVCSAGSQHGLPQYLVDLCRQAYGR
ncbi:hypothetical protein OG618_37790 (plasmid) [Kitasatospora sp. NBC_01246]|uniref:hypothetical protein n=1 Tax=Kitasatospora sp. NBC_01246 TaxID=2903570 RepID=UPI002E37742C|nr:hypothetical protein [Kitasatospora sp. NBC_01246]